MVMDSNVLNNFSDFGEYQERFCRYPVLGTSSEFECRRKGFLGRDEWGLSSWKLSSQFVLAHLLLRRTIVRYDVAINRPRKKYNPEWIRTWVFLLSIFVSLSFFRFVPDNGLLDQLHTWFLTHLIFRKAFWSGFFGSYFSALHFLLDLIISEHRTFFL